MIAQIGAYPASRTLIAWLMPPAVLTQIGLALFGAPLPVHAVLGLGVGFLALSLRLLTPASRFSNSQRALTGGLLAALCLQPCLIALRVLWLPAGAVHQINAFLIFGIAIALALDSDGGTDLEDRMAGSRQDRRRSDAPTRGANGSGGRNGARIDS